MHQPPWITLLLSGATCWLLLFPLRQILLRLGIIDRPNARSSHTSPVARGGGVAIVLIIAAGLGLLGQDFRGLLLPLLGLAAVSFWDDWHPLPARVRFAVHALAAGWALAWLQSGATAPSSALPLVLLPAAFLWVTGYTNAFNFMDGINGLAAGQAIVTGVGSALLGHAAGLPYSHPGIVLAMIIGGAAAGFLPHNFPRARLFMGDAGSASLGFLLAVIVLWIARDAGWWLGVPLLLLHANFILDTGVTLLRRIFRGDKWHEAHREHFYQRLVRAGRSHPFVTGVEILVQSAVLALVLQFLTAGPLLRLLLSTAVLTLWSVFFLYAERVFRRAGRA